MYEGIHTCICLNISGITDETAFDVNDFEIFKQKSFRNKMNEQIKLLWNKLHVLPKSSVS